MNTSRTKYGTISISFHAIASIAQQAALESYGVVGLADANFAIGLSRALSKNKHSGVIVNYENDTLILDLYIIVEYGTRISSVTNSVANSVKFKVESMTNLLVSEVNVHVRGLRVSNTD